MSIDIKAAKASFDKNGFTILKGFIEPEEITDIHHHLAQYIETIVPTLPASDVLYEDKDKPETMFRLERMQHYDDYFKQLIEGDRFVDLAKIFLEDDVVTRGLELFGKAPRIGQPTPPHQDSYYFMLEPPIAMTFWIALDRADETNGCMHYVQGSQKHGLRPHGLSDVLGFSQGVLDFGPEDTALEAAAIVDPGDVIAHNSMTVHRTDANPSDRPRRALGSVYFGKSAKVDKERSEAYRKMLFERWETDGKI